MYKLISILLTLFLFQPAIAFAQACPPGAFCNPLGNATICSLFVGILNAFMILGAPIAVVFVIIAGAKFVWARGNRDALVKAKENILWTLVGIAIFFGAIVITQVIFKTVSSFLSNNNQMPLECQI